MALTIPQLAVALRIIGAETDAVPAGVTAILTRQAAVARALATAHAPSAPEDVADEAVVRLTGFLYDQSPSLPRANNPMVASGAGSLLAPWHVARLLFPAGGPGAPAAAGGGVNTAAVEAIVAAAVEAIRQLPAGGADGQFVGHVAGVPAWTAAPAGAGGGLSAGQRAALEGAVQLDSVALSGNDLTLANDGGTAKSIPLALVPTIDNADAHKVLKVDAGGTTADWREDAGGLDQAAVDARVTALRPRAVPAFAQGDAGEVLTVADDGQSIRWEARPEPDELDTRAALPSTAGFEVGDVINVLGNLWKLAAGGYQSATHHGTIADRTGDLEGDDSFEFDSTAISAYLPRDVVGTAPPLTLWIEFDAGGYHLETLVTRASGGAVPKAGENWEFLQTTGRPLIDPDEVEVGSPFTVSFWQDEEKTTPLSVVPSTARWVHATAAAVNVSAWAQAGNADRVPKDKAPADAVYLAAGARFQKARLPDDTVYTADLPAQLSESFAILTALGVTVPATSGNRLPTGATLLNPAVDLDDHTHGEFHLSLELTIEPVSDVNMGFNEGTTPATAADRTVRLYDTVFVSALKAATQYQSIAAPGGLRVFTVNAYSNMTRVGAYLITAIRDSQNRVGFFGQWSGAAGATGMTITATLRAGFAPADTQGIATPTQTRLAKGFASRLDVGSSTISETEWYTVPLANVPTGDWGNAIIGVTLELRNSSYQDRSGGIELNVYLFENNVVRALFDNQYGMLVSSYGGNRSVQLRWIAGMKPDLGGGSASNFLRVRVTTYKFVPAS